MTRSGSTSTSHVPEWRWTGQFKYCWGRLDAGSVFTEVGSLQRSRDHATHCGDTRLLKQSIGRPRTAMATRDRPRNARLRFAGASQPHKLRVSNPLKICVVITAIEARSDQLLKAGKESPSEIQNLLRQAFQRIIQRSNTCDSESDH